MILEMVRMRVSRFRTRQYTLTLLACITLVLLLWEIIWAFSSATGATRHENDRQGSSRQDSELEGPKSKLPKQGLDADPVLKDLSFQKNGPAGHSNLDWDSLTQRYGYNVLKSRATDPGRLLPDTRPPSCVSLTSGIKHELPTASVVITFTNVDPSLLLRNIASLVLRSQPVLIKEIVVVDDGSRDGETFDWQTLSSLYQMIVLRNMEPKGRAAARLKGAEAATGEVIVFVDGTVEANVDWLSPLLYRLVQSPTSLVTPTLDVMDHLTFEYRPMPGVFRGGFDWSLEFRWEDVPYSLNIPPDPTEPIRSPIITGTVVAVTKDFFTWLGGYSLFPFSSDVEDLELSLKAWACGGQVEIVPCSRMGVLQVQGKELGARYNSYQNYLKGARRVAEVWLDEYKRFFYALRPSARMQQHSDVGLQRAQKEKLKCKSFKWYLSAVYPQLQPLISDEMAYGHLMQDDMCIDFDPGQLPLVAKLRPCDAAKDSQEWSWRKKGLILSSGMCLTSDTDHLQGYVVAEFCKEATNQIWYRHQEKIVHQSTGLCLDGSQGHKGLIVMECIKQLESQVWRVAMGEEPPPSTTTTGGPTDSILPLLPEIKLSL